MVLSWFKDSVVTEVFSAVLPIIAFLFAFQLFIIKRPVDNLSQVLIGIVMSTLGLVLFLEGLKLGFLPFGRQLGADLSSTGSAYLVIAFGSIFGYAVTLAEPNLRVLIRQVDTVSSGAIPGSLVMHLVAVSVGIALGLSMLRILLGIPLWMIIVPGYLLAFALIYFIGHTLHLGLLFKQKSFPNFTKRAWYSLNNFTLFFKLFINKFCTSS